jgi:hypothetical protein
VLLAGTNLEIVPTVPNFEKLTAAAKRGVSEYFIRYESSRAKGLQSPETAGATEGHRSC